MEEPSEKFPILSEVHRKKIFTKFADVDKSDVDKSDVDKFDVDKFDAALKETFKDFVSGIEGVNQTYWITRFLYIDKIKKIWDGEDVIDLLKYKKAMILYGPPGTSKSYQAKKYAEQLVGDKSKYESHIQKLQMHVNYSYDDFIGRLTYSGGEVKFREGFLLNLIKDIKESNDNETPYVLILDEINRTDISRVFGELFSAMECRNESISLMGDKNVSLNVPPNLYFIGTMNEIDFSLEHIDFALRRRFI